MRDTRGRNPIFWLASNGLLSAEVCLHKFTRHGHILQAAANAVHFEYNFCVRNDASECMLVTHHFLRRRVGLGSVRSEAKSLHHKSIKIV